MCMMVNDRKCLILVMGLMFLSGVTATATASCDIEQVCAQVEKAKKENMSVADAKKEEEGLLTDTIKEGIEEHCEDTMHKTNCPIDEVIQACWEGGVTEASDRCS